MARYTPDYPRYSKAEARVVQALIDLGGWHFPGIIERIEAHTGRALGTP